MVKEKKGKASDMPIRISSAPRVIPFQQIPADFRPLAVKITKLEKALMTTKNALDMNFDHLIDLLVDLKKTSIDLIHQAQMVEKIASKKEKEGQKS